MTISTILAATSEGKFAEINVPAWGWAALVGGITALLVADLLIVHRKPHAISFKEAAIESSVWIAIGVSFTAVMAWAFGGDAAGEYITG